MNTKSTFAYFLRRATHVFVITLARGEIRASRSNIVFEDGIDLAVPLYELRVQGLVLLETFHNSLDVFTKCSDQATKFSKSAMSHMMTGSAKQESPEHVCCWFSVERLWQA